jgi:hypothetical protein
MRITVVLMVVCVVILSGCSRDTVSQDSYNFLVIADKGFIKNKTEYDWWPKNEDSIFQGGGSGGSFTLGSGGGSGKDALVAMAVIVAVVIVAEATDVTYHNIRGMNVVIEIHGKNVNETYGLDWGMNRFRVTEEAMKELESGDAKLFVKSTGTRKLKLELPTEGLKIRRDVHVVEFSDTGNVIVDGNRVNLGLTSR